MLLSKKLTFYFVFSVLLVAALAFVVTPAMAQQTVMYSGTLTPATADAAGKWVVAFTFSEGGSFAKEHFTTVDTTQDPAVTTYNIEMPSGTNLTKEQFDAVTLENNMLTIPIAAGATTLNPTLDFTIRGYVEVNLTDSTTVPADAPIALAAVGGSLASRAYRVYSRVAKTSTTEVAATGGPILGNTVLATTVTDVADTDTDQIPTDLEDFFSVGGGTIDLNVTGTTKDSRHLIINEIMWASDARLRGQTGEFNQQWIEVYNPSVIPVLDTAISFNFIDDTFPAPAMEDGTSDRLSNIASRQNVWTLKGSSTGTTTLDDAATPAINGANPPFVSMYRNDYRAGGEGSGSNASNWSASGRAYYPGFLGTPGAKNVRAGLPATRPNPDAFTPPKDTIIINEVGNYSGSDLDWIELRNVGTGTVNIKNWRLNHTGNATDANYAEENIVQFADKDTNIAAGEILLIVNTDPEDTNLAAGTDIREGNAVNQQFGAGTHKYLNIKRSDGRELNIPKITSGFLILRSNGDNKFLTGRHHIRDVVGTSRLTRNTIGAATDIKEKETGYFWNTNAWPLNGHTGDNYRAHDAKDSSNGNASLQPDRNFDDGKVWARNGTNHGWRKDGGSIAGYSGGIGYDRGVEGNGTPGYPNDFLKGKVGDITDGALVISELMLTTNNGRYPQWIELQNTSRTTGINLAADGSDPKVGWQMIIENHNSGSWAENDRPLVATINLKEFGDIKYIPPNQTVLIASRTGRHSSGAGNFPSHRVASVWGTPHARTALGPKNSKDPMLNVEGGFYIKIVDGDGNVTDEIGNLDGQASNVRKGIGIDDPYSWLWPSDLTEDGDRTSLIRLKDGGVRGVQATSVGTPGTPRKGVPDREVDGDMTGMVLPMGIEHNRRGNGMVVMGMDADGNPMMVPAKYAGAAWIHASDVGLSDAQDNWYGDNDDIGTPLHTTGTPLPVELSHFRPELENGEVVIRWTTESELDNAGFNILRSDTRNGEFKQVNAEMIQGNGTTGERNTYKWVDATAKPGVVYYYQIEDVSFAGERQTLQTTKLKGYISAVGKATTTWGDIKEVQ